MPTRVVHPGTGFIEYRSTPEEIEMKKLSSTIESLSSTVEKLTKVLVDNNLLPDDMEVK